MKNENVIQTKTYMFAIRVVKLCQHLAEKKKEFILSKQLVRSGTGIGANVEEALGGQSRADFVAKLNIAYKEARETSYWLRLLEDTGYLTQRQFEGIHKDIEEIIRLLVSILKSSKGA